MKILIALLVMCSACELRKGHTEYHVKCISGDEVLFDGRTKNGFYITDTGIKIMVSGRESIFISTSHAYPTRCIEKKITIVENEGESYGHE